MRVLSPPLLLLALAGLSPAAHAIELWGTGPLSSSTLLVTSETHVRYRRVPEKLPGFEDRNIHDYVEQVERLNLLLSKEGLSIGAQLDEVALFSNRYILDGVEYQSWQLYDPEVLSPFDNALVVWEKGFVQRRWTHVDLTVGDTYASFGRGIALNVVKNTAVDIDTSIRGARAVVAAGDVEVTVISGLTNRQQISRLNVNVGIDEDIPHMVTGARVEHYAIGPAQVGLHGVVARFGRQEDREAPGLVRYEEPLDAVISGVTLAIPAFLGVDWYLEGDLLGYRSADLAGDVSAAPDGAAEELVGKAVYGSASLYPLGAVLLFEGKLTQDTERINTFTSPEDWELAAVPTLEYERVITEDSSAAVNSNDVYGGRVRLDLPLKPGELIPYLSVTGLRDEDLGTLHFNRSPETVVHPIAGVQWLKGEHILLVNAGYRQDVRDEAAEGSDQLLHLDGELSTPLFGAESLEIAVSVKQFLWGENVQDQEDFLEMENALVWKHGEKLDLIVYQDWSDNPLIPSTGNITDKLYGAFEVQYKPSHASQLSALVGAYKAGIRCSGGQCRTLPGFEGGQLSYTTQF